MFCVQCGTAIEAAQRFCPGCGKPAGPVAPVVARSRLAVHLRLLAFLWFALSAVRLIPGLILLSIFGSVESILPPDVPAFVYPIIRMVAWLFIGSAGIGLIAGWALLQRMPWARMLTLVLGLLSLIDIPFGTAIGIYTLWVLVPGESEAEYRRISQPA
jgi:hypothetical protein